MCQIWVTIVHEWVVFIVVGDNGENGFELYCAKMVFAEKAWCDLVLAVTATLSPDIMEVLNTSSTD